MYAPRCSGVAHAAKKKIEDSNKKLRITFPFCIALME